MYFSIFHWTMVWVSDVTSVCVKWQRLNCVIYTWICVSRTAADDILDAAKRVIDALDAAKLSQDAADAAINDANSNIQMAEEDLQKVLYCFYTKKGCFISFQFSLIQSNCLYRIISVKCEYQYWWDIELTRFKNFNNTQLQIDNLLKNIVQFCLCYVLSRDLLIDL